MNKRVFGYDAMKAIAAFFVVLFHLGVNEFEYHEGAFYYPSLAQTLSLFTSCGVPLFFAVNGALTINRNYNFKKTITKAVRLLLIALFWGFVARCVYAVKSHRMPQISWESLHYYWFLFSLAYFYIINYFLNHFPRWCKLTIIFALLVFPFITNYIWNVVVFINPSVSMPKWGHIGVFTLYGLVYMYVGDYLAHHQIKKYMSIFCIPLGLALSVFEVIAVVNYRHVPYAGANYAFPTLGALFMTIGLFVWLKEADIKNHEIKRFVSFLGNNALGIYIFHMILMAISSSVFQWSSFLPHSFSVPLLAIGYTTLSALISELIRKSPIAFLLKL